MEILTIINSIVLIFVVLAKIVETDDSPQREARIVQSFNDRINRLTDVVKNSSKINKKTVEEMNLGFEDHYKAICNVLDHLGLEVVAEQTKTVVTPAGLRKKKATKKKK